MRSALDLSLRSDIFTTFTRPLMVDVDAAYIRKENSYGRHH